MNLRVPLHFTGDACSDTRSVHVKDKAVKERTKAPQDEACQFLESLGVSGAATWVMCKATTAHNIHCNDRCFRRGRLEKSRVRSPLFLTVLSGFRHVIRWHDIHEPIKEMAERHHPNMKGFPDQVDRPKVYLA